jgi:hypothetical protein
VLVLCAAILFRFAHLQQPLACAGQFGIDLPVRRGCLDMEQTPARRSAV